MERYKMIKEVGDGTFGTVWRAIDKQSGEVVAIKKMKKKYYSWEECVNLREVKSLRRMNHPNIVKLKEVIRENDVLYFVLEYMECNLYHLMKDRSKLFSELEIRNWCFQIFQALAYMHHRGYFHRDLKPENFLVTKDIIKIADFGLAREVSSKPPFTEYVSTRWYRAPEVLLQSAVYGAAVDMWAMGAIMAELFTLRPLFPGSSEADEIYKICSVIGTPNQHSWAEGLHLADLIKYQFPNLTNVDLSTVIPSAGEDAINLISSLCSWDPLRRPQAAKVLQHSFFQPCFCIPPSLHLRVTESPNVPPSGLLASGATSNTPPSVGVKGPLGQKNSRRFSTGAFPSSKPVSNLSLQQTGSLRAGVQRKLEMDYKEREKNGTTIKNSVKQSPYQPPPRNNPAGYVGRNSRRVSDVATKLSSMTVNSRSDQGAAEKLAHSTVGSFLRNVKPQADSVKAKNLSRHNSLLNQAYQAPSGRATSRKVAG